VKPPSEVETVQNIAAAAVLASAPVLGDYVVIVMFAIFGAFVSVSRRVDIVNAPIHGAITMTRAVLISATFSWLAAIWLAARIDLPAVYILAPVAFGIAFVGDDWFRIKDIALDWLAARAKRDSP